MGYSLIKIDDIEPAGPAGAVRFVRRELGLKHSASAGSSCRPTPKAKSMTKPVPVRRRHGPRDSRARMEGFVVFDFARRYGEAGEQMVGWLREGWLYSREHVVDGIEKFPELLLMLSSGQNMGKLVRVADRLRGPVAERRLRRAHGRRHRGAAVPAGRPRGPSRRPHRPEPRG